jgi:hypothetical protein
VKINDASVVVVVVMGLCTAASTLTEDTDLTKDERSDQKHKLRWDDHFSLDFVLLIHSQRYSRSRSRSHAQHHCRTLVWIQTRTQALDMHS